ncbi:magnesium transporter [Aquisalimonas asiatica]|uniref:Magnesium transporter n=1 Tax=Aquisalimonas asiatica TaxID=406100 RepID=A0A1H8S4S1_9GAMM|nr:CBS domain-containing protein [Aquisalimonas asiatica]SEO73635.1 magnesium transporter [Aquisalimonas asiatica]
MSRVWGGWGRDGTAVALRALLERRDWRRLAELVEPLPPADVASVFADVPEVDWVFLYKVLPVDHGAEVFSYLHQQQRERLFGELTPQEREALLARLPADDLAFFIARLDAPERARSMQLLDKRRRAHVRRLLRHAPGTAGRLMTTEVIRLRRDRTVGEARRLIRDMAGRAETVETLAVSAADGAFAGLVTLEVLALEGDDTTLAALAALPPATVSADASCEEAARLLKHYDMLVLPVLDDNGRLLGLITSDDALDVMEALTTRSFHHFGGVWPAVASVRMADSVAMARSRVGVLLGCGLIGLAGAGLLAVALPYLQAFVYSLFLLPVILAVAGNVAIQTAALHLRTPVPAGARAWFAGLRQELAITVALGATLLGVVVPAAFWLGGSGLALLAGILVPLCAAAGGLVGAGAPLLLRRLGLDPAFAGTPMLTTLADVLALGLFLLALVGMSALGVG